MPPERQKCLKFWLHNAGATKASDRENTSGNRYRHQPDGHRLIAETYRWVVFIRPVATFQQIIRELGSIGAMERDHRLCAGAQRTSGTLSRPKSQEVSFNSSNQNGCRLRFLPAVAELYSTADSPLPNIDFELGGGKIPVAWICIERCMRGWGCQPALIAGHAPETALGVTSLKNVSAMFGKGQACSEVRGSANFHQKIWTAAVGC